MSDTILQVWTAPRCQSGTEPLGPIAHIASGTVVEALRGAQGPVLTLPRAVADGANLRAGAWLWVSHQLRGVSEWPILTVDTGDGRSRDLVQVQCGTMRQAIALRGTVRTVNTYGPVTTAFTLPALTPAQILTTYVLANLAADALDWLTLGTIDYSGTIALGTVNQWTRGQCFDAIEAATGYRIVLVRTATGYRIDLRDPTAFAAALDTELLAPGVTVDDLVRTEDLLSAATVAEPRASDGSAMRDTWWRVGAITGSGPYWVTLEDPTDGPAVIRENDEVNGWYLRPNDGLPVVITDSRASDSSVEVASRAGLVVGGLASLWADDAGRLSATVESPSGVARRGRVVVPVSVSVASTRANRLPDPTGAAGLAGWEELNATAGGKDVFLRTDPTTVALTINGAVSGGATSIDVDSAPGQNADGVIRFGDALTVAGTAVDASASAVTDASGDVTVNVSPNLPLTIAGDTALAWTRGGVNVGTVTTNGTQSSGASSLSLKGLTATPQLTAGDTLVASVAGVITLFVGYYNYTDQGIPNGASIEFTERRTRTVGTTVTENVYTWTGVTSGITVPGAVASVDESLRPSFLSGEVLVSLSGTYAYSVTVTTLTLSGAQPAWSSSLAATAVLSATTTQTAGTRYTWLRAGAALGTVEVASSTVASTSLPLTLLSNYTRVLSGDRFALPAQTLYADANVTLSGAGAGTIPLRAAASAIADNTAVTVVRCQDYAPTAFGGPVVLRLRGNAAALPGTYKGGSDYALYSPILYVQSPDPTQQSGAYYGLVSIGLTRWAAEAGQTQSGFWCVWDVDTGAQLSSGGFGSGAPAFTPLFNVATNTTIPVAQFVPFGTAPRRVRLSIHPSGGQSSAIGGYTFLRYVALTVTTDASGTAALVDGGFSNQLWHRGHDVLDAGRDISRYRVTLSGPAAQQLADVVPGQTVRLRSPALDVDTPLRIARVVWSLRTTDRMELEVAALTPRLSEVV